MTALNWKPLEWGGYEKDREARIGSVTYFAQASLATAAVMERTSRFEARVAGSGGSTSATSKPSRTPNGGASSITRPAVT